MPDNVLVTPLAPPAPHPAYRPPLGLPLRRESRWGSVVSLLVHALVMLLILVPLFEHDVLLQATRGGGGPGPAGGGGGGNRGTGGAPRQENVRYFAVRPVAAPPQALVAPQPKPVLPPPPPPEPVPPKIAKIDVKVDAGLPPVAIAPVVGTGGGTGSDGTGGTGPGTGGGIGSGVGTGTGSGNGPGTGGDGMSDTMIAHPTYQPMPFDPAPASVRGKPFKVQFVLDERGTILRVQFASSGDRSYDRVVRETFSRWTFRPAVLRTTGAPVPSVYEISLVR